MSVNLGKIKSGPNYKPYMIFFVLVSIGVIAFVVNTSLAKTTVTLHPKKDTTRGFSNVNVSPDATGNLAAFNAVKGRISEKEIHTTKIFSGVEKKEIDSYAKGVVTLHNERSEEQPLLSGTQLISDNGVLFKTKERTVIPPGGTVNVNVAATEKGVGGNIEPTHFIIVKLWENWQNVIFGESSEQMRGGRVNDFVVTNESFENAKEDIKKQVADDIVAEFSPTLKENELITKETVLVDIIDFKPLVRESDIAESFDVKVKAVATAVTFNKILIKDIATEKIQSQISESKEILSLDTENFTYTLKSIDAEKKSAVIEVSIEAETTNKIPTKALEKNELVGRNYGDLIAYYKQFDEIGDIDVVYSPFWVSSVPANEGNIEIKIQ